MTDQKHTIDIGWNFDNSYAELPDLMYTKQDPTPVRAPQIIAFNVPLAEALGLNIEALQSDEGAAVFAGNEIPPGALPLAQAYAGHQFGHFTMLGDGRAILLGEQITPQGKRVDIQLKGAGRTPYSRGGDGRAAIGPMLREYIISESMHALGIPTTRSLAVVATGQPVTRERDLPGAILTRVASSHLRVGTFQYARGAGTTEDLRILADYTLQRHYPDADRGTDGNRYLVLLQEVIKRQADLIAKWQLVGFVHGVMNTDNMTLSGESIDYGPCAFMDTFNPSTVFSSIDSQGRYAYSNQPYIAEWNLARLAEALLPLIHEDEDEAINLAEDALASFTELYYNHWLAGMRAKLGIFHEEEQDEALIKSLLGMMQKHGADYTNTFRALTLNQSEVTSLSGTTEFDSWYAQWQERLGRQEESKTESRELMRSSNPAVIPRNHRVEEALEAAEQQGDFSVMERLLSVLANPYAYSPEQEEYAAVPPESPRPYRTYCGT